MGVELAERQYQATIEDLEWTLNSYIFPTRSENNANPSVL